MLYVTTRNRQEAFTVHHVLTKSRGDDGGLFLPMRLPKFTSQEIRKFYDMSFGQRVAQILNLFFSVNLSGWDVDFSVGRYPVRTAQLAHRILLAETWHNPEQHYLRLEKNLAELIRAEAKEPGNWVSIAVRMAVLAAILGNQEFEKSALNDISVISGDFTSPISLIYLRKMGFPIGNIICCCNENNQIWELTCNGQFRTDCISIPTIVPEADITLPVNLERMIFEYGPVAEVERYLNACRTGAAYSVSDNCLQQLRHGLYVSVVSSNRVETTIPNVYKTHKQVLTPSSALAYSGLLDYRAKTGITRTAVVICDKNPICDAEVVASAMEIPVEELKKII